jgi:hypothetical protein
LPPDRTDRHDVHAGAVLDEDTLEVASRRSRRSGQRAIAIRRVRGGGRLGCAAPWVSVHLGRRLTDRSTTSGGILFSSAWPDGGSSFGWLTGPYSLSGPRNPVGRLAVRRGDSFPRPRQRFREPLRVHRLQQIVDRVDGESTQRMLLVGRDEDDLDRLIEQLEHLEAVELGHLDVEEEEIGAQLGRGLDRLEPVGALRDDLDVGMRGEVLADEPARQLLVVDDDGTELPRCRRHRITGPRQRRKAPRDGEALIVFRVPRAALMGWCARDARRAAHRAAHRTARG